MSWKEKIPGCFGNDDLIFGGHPDEIEIAKEMFKKALDYNVELDDIVNECRDYLISKNATKKHINEQEKIVRDFCYKNFE